jgi:hypothetical protein
MKQILTLVTLQAGRKRLMRVEWEGDPGREGEFHLNRESVSQLIEHVPNECLYPETPTSRS